MKFKGNFFKEKLDASHSRGLKDQKQKTTNAMICLSWCSKTSSSQEVFELQENLVLMIN